MNVFIKLAKKSIGALVRYPSAKIYCIGQREYARLKVVGWKKDYDIDDTVSFYQANETSIYSYGGRITIGSNSYFNRSLIVAGYSSNVVIGKCCAIGYNTNICAVTHDNEIATGSDRPFTEGDIVIGDNVWIGANCYIREGVSIGDNAIIGANSVVTKNVLPFEIVGGVPARHIRFKKAQNNG